MVERYQPGGTGHQAPVRCGPTSQGIPSAGPSSLTRDRWPNRQVSQDYRHAHACLENVPSIDDHFRFHYIVQVFFAVQQPLTSQRHAVLCRYTTPQGRAVLDRPKEALFPTEIQAHHTPGRIQDGRVCATPIARVSIYGAFRARMVHGATRGRLQGSRLLGC